MLTSTLLADTLHERQATPASSRRRDAADCTLMVLVTAAAFWSAEVLEKVRIA